MHFVNPKPDNCAVVGYYAACVSNSLPTLRDRFLIDVSGLVGPETTVITTTRSRIVQKSEVLICIAAGGILNSRTIPKPIHHRVLILLTNYDIIKMKTLVQQLNPIKIISRHQPC